MAVAIEDAFGSAEVVSAQWDALAFFTAYQRAVETLADGRFRFSDRSIRLIADGPDPGRVTRGAAFGREIETGRARVVGSFPWKWAVVPVHLQERELIITLLRLGLGGGGKTHHQSQVHDRPSNEGVNLSPAFGGRRLRPRR
jgi:hypothetical protein